MRCVALLCDHSQNQWVIADLLVKAKADLDVISHKVHECDVQCLYGICTLQALHGMAFPCRTDSPSVGRRRATQMHQAIARCGDEQRAIRSAPDVVYMAGHVRAQHLLR